MLPPSGIVPASIGYNGWQAAGQRLVSAGSSSFVQSPPASTMSISFLWSLLFPLKVGTEPIRSGNDEI